MVIARKEDVNTEFIRKGIRRRNQMAGDRARDEPQTDVKERFKTEVFYAVYDRIIQEMTTRFTDFCTKVKDFGSLMPSHLGKKDMFRKLA